MLKTLNVRPRYSLSFKNKRRKRKKRKREGREHRKESQILANTNLRFFLCDQRVERTLLKKSIFHYRIQSNDAGSLGRLARYLTLGSTTGKSFYQTCLDWKRIPAAHLDANEKENTRQGCLPLLLHGQYSSTHDMNCVLRYLGSLFSCCEKGQMYLKQITTKQINTQWKVHLFKHLTRWKCTRSLWAPLYEWNIKRSSFWAN